MIKIACAAVDPDNFGLVGMPGAPHWPGRRDWPRMARTGATYYVPRLTDRRTQRRAAKLRRGAADLSSSTLEADRAGGKA